jgi:hypothetical protein
VPANAQVVKLGSNFAQDLSDWAKTTSSLDLDALAQPSVATLLGQLNTQYAFVINSDDLGNHSYELVVMLPSTLSPPLALGDAAVESGLASLVL